MAPTSFDIYELNDVFAMPETTIPAPLINDAFAVDEVFAPRTGPSLRTSFEVDEDTTNLTSSSSESVMPQFSCADERGMSLPVSDVVPAPLLRTDGRQAVNPWDPRLIGDLALGVDSTEEVIDRYGVSKEEFERLCEVPAFRRELSVAVRDLRENGTAYSEKCKAMSSTYLERIDQLIYDNATPASTVLAAVQYIAKMGKLEPREEKADAGSNATQVNINICYT